jgi:hypothetical protein
MKTYSNKFFIPVNNKNIIFHLFGMDLMIDKFMKIKVLEINIYPTHFISGYLDNYDNKTVSKLLSNPNRDTKLKEMVNYEKQLLDEILSLTLDTKYKTSRDVKLKYLIKV